jgi:hypothetical protein
MAYEKDLGGLSFSTITRASIWSQRSSSTAVYSVTGKEYARPGMISLWMTSQVCLDEACDVLKPSSLSFKIFCQVNVLMLPVQVHGELYS